MEHTALVYHGPMIRLGRCALHWLGFRSLGYWFHDGLLRDFLILLGLIEISVILSVFGWHYWFSIEIWDLITESPDLSKLTEGHLKSGWARNAFLEAESRLIGKPVSHWVTYLLPDIRSKSVPLAFYTDLGQNPYRSENFNQISSVKWP